MLLQVKFKQYQIRSLALALYLTLGHSNSAHADLLSALQEPGTLFEIEQGSIAMKVAPIAYRTNIDGTIFSGGGAGIELEYMPNSILSYGVQFQETVSYKDNLSSVYTAIKLGGRIAPFSPFAKVGRKFDYENQTVATQTGLAPSGFRLGGFVTHCFLNVRNTLISFLGYGLSAGYDVAFSEQSMIGLEIQHDRLVNAERKMRTWALLSNLTIIVIE